MENQVLHPLSKAQLALWVSQQLDPASAALNIGEYIEIPGNLDPELFDAALRTVVASCDSLHLRILATGNKPLQEIKPDLGWALPKLDFSAQSDPVAAAIAWMRDDMGRTVDPTRGPLFGYALLRIALSRWFWYSRYHHLCNDGFGVALIARRVARLYRALAQGTPPETEYAGSWLDALKDEDDYQRSPRCESDRDYWRQELANPQEPVTLSGRPPEQSRSFIRCTGWLSRPEVDALRALGMGHRVSLAAGAHGRRGRSWYID